MSESTKADMLPAKTLYPCLLFDESVNVYDYFPIQYKVIITDW